MKSFAMTILAAALSACAGGDTGPTKLPKDAFAGMWSAKPSAAVATCLAQTGLGDAYEARPLNRKVDGGYQTIVVVKTQQWATPQQATAYSRCL